MEPFEDKATERLKFAEGRVMKENEEIKLPFTIERGEATPMVAQLTGGIAQAIESGFWKPGEALPTLAEFVEKLGVSQIVVRQAIRRLVKDGFVNPRPGVGTVVNDRNAKIWRGQVLVVDFEMRLNYFYSVISGILRERLLKAGFMPVTVSMIAEEVDKKYDMSPLKSMLRQPFALAVVLGHHAAKAAVKLIAKTGTPIVTIDADGTNLKGLAAHVAITSDEAVAAMIESINADGKISRVVQFRVIGNDFAKIDPKKLRQGVKLEDCEFAMPGTPDAAQSVRKGAREYFERWLCNQKRLPDLLYFNDDYAAEAALMVLLRRGIKVPEEVRMVTLAHRGNEVAYPWGIGAILNDPFAEGEALAEAALKVLNREKVVPVTKVPMRYEENLQP